MTVRRDHGGKPRRRARRSTDKRGPVKLTPKRAALAAKRRLEHEPIDFGGVESCAALDDIFNQA